MQAPTKPARLATEIEALRESCSSAVRSLGEYAPEIEPGDAGNLSEELAELSRVIAATYSAAEGSRVRAGVRVALRVYQRQVHGRLSQMREQVQAAQIAISEFATTISAHDARHEDGIQRELETLKTVAEVGDLTSVRAALGQACTGIRTCQTAFVRTQRMVLLQLHDEVRVLRDTIALHQQEGQRDPESGAWRREYMEREIRARCSRQETVGVLLLSIHNLARLQEEHSKEAILGVFEAFCKRLSATVRNIGSDDELIARWSPNAFAVLLPATGPPVEAMRNIVCGRLPGSYAVQADGTPSTLVLDLSVSIIDLRAEVAANR